MIGKILSTILIGFPLSEALRNSRNVLTQISSLFPDQCLGLPFFPYKPKQGGQSHPNLWKQPNVKNWTDLSPSDSSLHTLLLPGSSYTDLLSALRYAPSSFSRGHCTSSYPQLDHAVLPLALTRLDSTSSSHLQYQSFRDAFQEPPESASPHLRCS